LPSSRSKRPTIIQMGKDHQYPNTTLEKQQLFTE